jgi:hypothetical protein
MFYKINQRKNKTEFCTSGNITIIDPPLISSFTHVYLFINWFVSKILNRNHSINIFVHFRGKIYSNFGSEELNLTKSFFTTKHVPLGCFIHKQRSMPIVHEISSISLYLDKVSVYETYL